MGEKTIVPFGPQHPVLPEPVHLDLVLEDEKVVDVIPSIGFIHRGLEKLVEKREFGDFVHVAERICGICSFIHGMTYCYGIETIMKIEVPARADFVRLIFSELSRLHSHLLWAGLMADAIGFESLFMQAWRIREKVLDILEETTGGRVIFGVCKVGGMRRDIDNARLAGIASELDELQREINNIAKVFDADATIRLRLGGVGVLARNDAHDLGAVGPMARASGISHDMRMLGYGAYKHMEFEPLTETEGDSLARCRLRFREMNAAIKLIQAAVKKIPDGPVDLKVTGMPEGEFFARTEQPRGEVLYYLKANGTKYLERMRVRTPTFANLAPMIKMLKGCELADVPVLILTIDPCVSCTER